MGVAWRYYRRGPPPAEGDADMSLPASILMAPTNGLPKGPHTCAHKTRGLSCFFPFHALGSGIEGGGKGKQTHRARQTINLRVSTRK